ncbi:hypothetical protein XELAEV_18014608mg [Xenopus laevis]|uniref:Uncharacterized protein n=1 Tax=Xenopus laevis TaxID=8355 RepID=A0A974HVB3_XENLA|nr:hypothetical protein XELAEV_18014608mg [Xenopus laevis]
MIGQKNCHFSSLPVSSETCLVKRSLYICQSNPLCRNFCIFFFLLFMEVRKPCYLICTNFLLSATYLFSMCQFLCE